MLRSLCLFTVSALAITVGTQAQANTKVTQSFKLKNAGFSATFFGGDECSSNAMTFFYSETVQRVDGVTERLDPITFVELEYHNVCTGEDYFLSGVTSQPQVTIRGDSGAATLDATIPVSNEAGTVMTNIFLNVDLAATGPSVIFKERFKSNEGGVKFKLSFTSESRPAEATGTATVDLPSGTANLIFGPSLTANIARNVLGDVTVTKPQN